MFFCEATPIIIGQLSAASVMPRGISFGKASDNSILDTCLHDIELADGEVNTLIANAIAHTVYAQCTKVGMIMCS